MARRVIGAVGKINQKWSKSPSLLDEYSSAVLACSGGCGPSNNSIEYIVPWRGLEWLGMDQYNCPELRE